MEELRTTFQVSVYNSGPMFNFPKKQCELLGISGGDTVHLIIRKGTDEVFRGRKTLKSGTEIYGSDLALRLIPGSTIEVEASEPIRAERTLQAIASETQELESGFETNPETRKKVELYAMNLAKRELAARGYEKIMDTSTTESYDYVCERDGILYYVEVKGTRGKGNSVFVTKNEVVHAQNHRKNSIAILVTQIDLSHKGNERICFIAPWNPMKIDLLPLVYRWDVPNSICEDHTFLNKAEDILQ